MFEEASISCANVVETLEKVIFIPEKNVETRKISRYLMLVQYAVKNNSDKNQIFQILHGAESGVQINGEQHYIEEAKYIDLDESVSGEEEWIEEVPANSTLDNLYCAFWIYKDYNKDTYYYCNPIARGDMVTAVIGIGNGQAEEGATLHLMIP